MLADLLRRHDGVITFDQAVGCGISKYAIHRRVQSGAWTRCSRGVFFVADRPFTDAARIRSTIWGLGARATSSGLAAAWWLDLTRFAPDVVEVTVPRVSNHPRRSGTRIRRRGLHTADVIERSGLRVTAMPLTVIEGAVRRGGGPKLMDSALQRHVELRALWKAQLRNKGRHGSPAARRLLIQLLKTAGITGWKANYPVAGYEVDVGFAGCKIALEAHGLAFHSDSDAFHNDRARQNAIVLAGWQVLRFTWIDLTEYPDRVIATIRSAISAR